MTGEGMTMDLENELRQAMAAHVADVSAPESLAVEARRGHHKTVRVRALTITAVAAVVVAIAAMPAYQAFRPETVGAPGRAPSGTPAGGLAPSAPRPVEAPATPSAPARASTPAGRPGTIIHPPAAPSSPGGGGRIGQSLLTYLPSGLRRLDPCATTKAADRQVTSCRWTGSGGLIEIKLIRGPSFADPSDIGYFPPMSMPARVHDRPAIRGEWADMGSQVAWVERSGLGVWVGVDRALNGQLMRIAEGVRVTS
jgi:hypothetical protein